MNFSSIKIGDLVSRHKSVAQVMDRFNLDYYSNGSLKLSDVVRDTNLDYKKIHQQIEEAIRAEQDVCDYQSLSLTELSDLIRTTCHTQLRNELPQIKLLSHTVKERFESQYQVVRKIHDLLLAVIKDLMPHLLKEENVLFPYIEYMEMSYEKGTKPRPPAFEKLENPLRQMTHEHDRSLQLFNSMRSLTSHYTAPAVADDDWKMLYIRLEEQEFDLHWHLHLENNLLFPKAQSLESQIMQSSSHS